MGGVCWWMKEIKEKNWLITGGDGEGIGVWDIDNLDKILLLRRVRGKDVGRIRTCLLGRMNGKIWLVGSEE